ncbi:hypothetical protein DQG13_27810 [Paenibacillus sp. YN15]|nr:hypothetical protein DQG13_27810 [Paenibacillus sp. YN15]
MERAVAGVSNMGVGGWKGSERWECRERERMERAVAGVSNIGVGEAGSGPLAEGNRAMFFPLLGPRSPNRRNKDILFPLLRQTRGDKRDKRADSGKFHSANEASRLRRQEIAENRVPLFPSRMIQLPGRAGNRKWLMIANRKCTLSPPTAAFYGNSVHKLYAIH